jgi:uroporphyrinogen decarboxylase
MAYDGLLKDIRTIVRLGKPSRVPVFACSEEFDVKWYGRGTYNEVILDPEKLAACWIATIEEFDYDWAWLQIDDCIEFEPLGVGCKGEGDILRATCEYLPAEPATLKKLKMPDPKKDGRMPIHLEAIRKVRNHFGDRVLVTGRTAAPFSSVALLYGIQETMMLMFSDPQLLRDTCEFFIELQTMWGIAQFEAGAHALWLGDCNAMSNLISLKQYTDFAFEPCKRLVENYKKAGGLTMLHNSEIKLPYLVKSAEMKPDILSMGPEADLAEVKKALGSKIALIGNLDQVKYLLNSGPQEVAAEAARIMETGKPGGAYIFNTGDMVPRDVPEENMRTMMRAARQHGSS